MTASNSTPDTNLCKNCQAELQGEYCHRCGQQDKQYIRSIFAVVGDLFGEIGHWDSRFYRTLRGLFLNPGFLSLEFVQGRHASYVPPLRLYFFISLISFMVFTSLIEFEIKSSTEVKPYVDAEKRATGPLDLSPEETDIPFMTPEEELRLEEKLKYLAENPAQFSQKLVSMTPQMMLLMLPFWALFLKIIYLFGQRYYLEHLTVALHTHAFILLTLMIITIIAELTEPMRQFSTWSWLAIVGDWATNILLIWLFGYLILTQKRFYQQRWSLTVLKFMVSGAVYVALLTTSFVIMVIIGILNS
ncbi:DUF3667 domain-containing protein [Idiomarina sp. HP20-50]|uniref:DUF3667 domain-containing protein n=1 Tax=Idiomarina sp. HP20-50 TaxID=3070813 RepID=UPI00294AA77A|nr:DUF3667 domain-containing protein [Idiomarina sp. HP20-50]MDV6315168.1 DUF3667 domain-containing protein [Idiomarina sp. HP20-50]